MAETIKVGIIGGGWPGNAHAQGYLQAGGFKVVAVADLIPERRRKMMTETGAPTEYADALDLVRDKNVDAVSVCLPTHLHAPVTIAALRAGKHVVCEKPPGLTTAEAKKMMAAGQKSGKVLLYALQRRFGVHEQAAKQAITKGYAGDVYHARAVWTRTRGIPIGTGWFTQKEKSGGGALIDLGTPMLDLGWYLLGQPRPLSVYGVTHRRLAETAIPQGLPFDVEDAAFAVIKFEGGKSLELSTSWALNQPPAQNGVVCRAFGTGGALEVYTPHGPVLYRGFEGKGQPKETALKGPKVSGHAAMARHFRECILGRATPLVGGPEGVALMEMIEGVYESAEKGKSVHF